MRPLLRTAAAVALVATAGSMPLAAQGLTMGEEALGSAGRFTVGPILALNFPVGDLTDLTNTGLTFGGQATYGLGVVALLGEVSYTNFTGKEAEGGGSIPDYSTVEVAGGARVGIPLAGLYVGGVAGYWTSDADEFDVVPMAGIHLGPADLGVRYKGLLGDVQWVSITGAVHFRL